MNLNHATNKTNGSKLEASEWNSLAADVNELGASGVGGSDNSNVTVTQDTNATDATVNVAVVSGVQDIASPNVLQLTKKSKGVNTTIVSGNNINIEPRESTGKAKNTKGGNISLKPGDDIEFCSHHRRFGNRDEVTVKVIDGEDNPVKLQLKAGEITLSTEGKGSTMTKDEDTGLDTATPLYDNANVMDVNVTTGSGKGYLKVRAQAIDLRCEENGGIALQPKGDDGSGHENKIKFEHNGGDGKEFGTFNTEKTSIFTDEYRFNESGKVYAVTRGNLVTTYKEDGVTPKKVDYPTQSDDFKDIIDAAKSCTWNDIIVAVNYIKSQNPSLGWTPASNA